MPLAVEASLYIAEEDTLPGDILTVKNRNPIFVVVLSVVTFFLYGLYWFYQTRNEVNEVIGGRTSALLWTIGLFIPFVNLYVLWKYCEDLVAATKSSQSAVVYFILWVVFFPAAQYLMQQDLNKIAA